MNRACSPAMADVGNAADARGDHRIAGRHAFQQRVGQALGVVARQREHIRLAEQPLLVGTEGRAGEATAAPRPSSSARRRRPASSGPLPTTVSCASVPRAQRVGQALQQFVQALLADQPAQIDQPQRLAGRARCRAAATAAAHSQWHWR